MSEEGPTQQNAPLPDEQVKKLEDAGEEVVDELAGLRFSGYEIIQSSLASQSGSNDGETDYTVTVEIDTYIGNLQSQVKTEVGYGYVKTVYPTEDGDGLRVNVEFPGHMTDLTGDTYTGYEMETEQDSDSENNTVQNEFREVPLEEVAKRSPSPLTEFFMSDEFVVALDFVACAVHGQEITTDMLADKLEVDEERAHDLLQYVRAFDLLEKESENTFTVNQETGGSRLISELNGTAFEAREKTRHDVL